MLRNTFCHLPGIGAQTERKLWQAGLTSWDNLLEQSDIAGRYPVRPSCREVLRESVRRYEQGDPAYFAALLPPNQRWRLFPDFRGQCAYLDIETTGLGGFGDHITTVTIYDGGPPRHFIHGENLNDVPDVLAHYKLLVTYNGATFDLPFLERQFRIKIEQAHIDLRYVLKTLGFGGGLKNCERRLGVERQGMEGIDGAVAVLLWHEFKRRRDAKALETLLAYNVQDALNLEILMVEAYNRKLDDTPFANSHRLPAAAPAANPFAVDQGVLARLLRGQPWILPFAR
ncbi:MAG TPA: ribonuclease H-like domain-containing protein [Gemmataceae bacterium]|nr:ribonuclease H-like domain-containing protein [Gemmataceae bacterium]